MPDANSTNEGQPRFAFFDLDHTIIPHDTQLLFCNYVLHHEGWRRLFHVPFFLCIPLAACRVFGDRSMKRIFLGYLWGMKKDRLAGLAEKFANEEFPKQAYPAIVGEVRRHKDEGRVTVLNTASPQIYAEPIARWLGFDHCYATRVDIPKRMRLHAKILGPNNKRAAKIDAMVDILPAGITGDNRRPIAGSVAYTDSVNDTPLLDIAEIGYVVNPSKSFDEIRATRGWHLLKPPTPYHGKWGNYWAMVRQLLGVFPVASRR